MKKSIVKRPIKPVLVVNQNGKLKTDSLVVAKVFEREHFNLLRDIKNITDSDAYQKRIKNGTQSNFELCFRINELANGKKVPYYEMDRQGFEILAMGFTGEKALEWKFKYSDAFAAMEAELLKQRPRYVERPLDLVDLGLGLLQVGIEQRIAQKRVRNRWVNVLGRSIQCGNIWIQRLTNEIYQTLLACPQATARNFRQHMNLPAISAEFLTRDQMAGHVQYFVSGVEYEGLRMFEADPNISFGDLRDFALAQAKLYHQQLLRVAQGRPSELIFNHEYNIIPILPYRERRMQTV